MKDNIIKLIKILGFGVNELVFDIHLSIAIFNSIEYDDVDGNVYLNLFKDNNYELVVNFEELSKEDQLKVYQLLSIIYN